MFVALLNMAAEVKLAEIEAEVAAVPAVFQRMASLKDKRAKGLISLIIKVARTYFILIELPCAGLA